MAREGRNDCEEVMAKSKEAPIPQTKEVHDLGFINLMLKQTSGPPLLQT
jgi:hypothetical protein